MRILGAVIAATLVLGTLPAETLGAEDLSGARETVPGAPEKSRSEKLDDLFATLKTAAPGAAAEQAETSILSIWLDSGSPTVDLLMDWTIDAIEEKNYSLALDFLDRITTLEPEYVEGWNKRATVYYLTDDYARSLADIERVLALEPRHFSALAGLGSILRELGDEKRALEAYREAIAVDPLMDKVREAIDELEAKDGGQDI